MEKCYGVMEWPWFFCVICLTLPCFLRSAACVTSGAERWRKPKMTSEDTLFFLSLPLSLRAHLWSLRLICLFTLINHPVMLTCTDGLTWCVQWRCPRSGSATRPREAPSTPVGFPCSATNWWVDTCTDTHRHTDTHTHTDVVLEFPRSLRTSSL